MKPPVRKLTADDLVGAVTAAGLDDAADPATRAKLESFLARQGFDALDWLRAKRDMKRTP